MKKLSIFMAAVMSGVLLTMQLRQRRPSLKQLGLKHLQKESLSLKRRQM